MWQKPGLVQDEPGAPGHVFERGRAPKGGELVAGDAVANLRLVAQGEEGLAAACGGACPRNLEHFLLAHVRPLPAPRGPGERAVTANVAAELRQRNEDLRRVGDKPAVADLAESPGLRGQRRPRLVDERKRLRRGESFTHRVSLRAD